MTFANPGFLFLLLIVPALAVWYFYRRKVNPAVLQVSSVRGFRKDYVQWRHYLYNGLYVARLLSITLLILALARPQTSLSRQSVNVEGIDLVIALDISGSMLAQDFRPNRIEAAKDIAMEFIDGRPNDRIGLVIFSGESFTQCPITTDHAVLKNLFQEIKSGMIEDGTAIGDGLALAISRLKDSKAVSKVIILLTDGVSNMGSVDPLSAAEIGKLFGIRIYTVGIGTIGYAPYPVQTPFGIQMQQMKVDIDEPRLIKISQMTDGKYFRALNNTKLREIYKEIDKMEKTRIDVTEFRKKKEEFLPLILIAFILLALEGFVRYFILKTIP
ncbi:MAG: VWA domain-containing protein [Bacteroidetes bacterium]|nr:VWA domain-containing protein [Bacteroidota bacterium]